MLSLEACVLWEWDADGGGVGSDACACGAAATGGSVLEVIFTGARLKENLRFMVGSWCYISRHPGMHVWGDGQNTLKRNSNDGRAVVNGAVNSLGKKTRDVGDVRNARGGRASMANNGRIKRRTAAAIWIDRGAFWA